MMNGTVLHTQCYLPVMLMALIPGLVGPAFCTPVPPARRSVQGAFFGNHNSNQGGFL